MYRWCGSYLRSKKIHPYLSHPISEASIQQAIQEIRNMTADFLSALNETYTYIEILGPWQTYQIPEDRKECVVSPWRLLIAAIDSLPTVCSTDRKLTPLACDACVQSH